jgi:SAM-dependent methyltransferase
MVGVAGTRAAVLRVGQDENGSPVEFHVADAQQLPFGDGTFDGVRCERVLTYVPDPLLAIGEMVRVAKPGAPVVVTEADWATYVFDLPNVERALIQKFVRQINEAVAAGWIGRTLPRALKDAGLRDVTVSVGGLIYPSAHYFLDIDTGRASIARLAAEGWLTADEARQLVKAMEQADREHRFFGAVTLFTACGRTST